MNQFGKWDKAIENKEEIKHTAGKSISMDQWDDANNQRRIKNARHEEKINESSNNIVFGFVIFFGLIGLSMGIGGAILGAILGFGIGAIISAGRN